MAREYIKDYSIIIVFLPSVSYSSVRQYLDNYKIVIVQEMDTQPFYRRSMYHLYNILYSVTNPSDCGRDFNTIVDSYFAQKLNMTSFPALFDYFVPSTQKVSDITNWAEMESGCGWSYKTVGKGAVIEVPYDGYWRSASILEKMMKAISERFLGVTLPRRIIYLGLYTTNAPEWHGGVDNISYMWSIVASRNKMELIDLR